MNPIDFRTIRRAMPFAAWVLFAAAHAADAPPSAPPDKGRPGAQACRADAERLCANVERGGGRRMTCLREHKDQLSPACRDGLAEMGENRKAPAPK